MKALPFRKQFLAFFVVLLAWGAFPEGKAWGEEGEAPRSSAGKDSQRLPSIDFRTSVELVEVTISATQGGKFVADLLPGDFRVRENGKPVQVVDVVLHQYRQPQFELAAEALQEKEQAIPVISRPGRDFILFFDLLTSSSRKYELMLPAVQRFLLEILAPEDRCLVAVLDWKRKLRVVTPLTRDRARIASVLEKLQGNRGRNGYHQQVVQEMLDSVEIMLLEGSDASSNSDAITQRSALESARAMAFQRAKRRAAIETSEGKLILRSLTALLEWSQRQGIFNKHKHLVLISAGAPSNPGIAYLEFIQVLLGEDLDIPTARSFSDFELQDVLNDSVRDLLYSNVTLYSIDSRGMHIPTDWLAQTTVRLELFAKSLEGLLFREPQSSLNSLSSGTGGTFFGNSNDFGNAFEKIEEDTAYRYVLTYQMPQHPKKKKKKKKQRFYKIEVDVARPGVQVRARKGYWE